MSFIRYRCKSEKDFTLFPCHGMGCSIGDFKQFLMKKSSKLASHHSKDQIDFLITDASTNAEYQHDSDLIPRHTSVIVIRRLRETFEPLTAETNPHQPISFDGTIERFLTPGLLSKTKNNAISCKNTSEKVTSKLELVKNTENSLHPTIKATSYVCHHCKRCGHIKRHCPLLIERFALISPSKSHSCFVNNKDPTFCSRNDIHWEESSFNKTQIDTDTHDVMSAYSSSTFSSTNNSLQQSPLNFVGDSLRKDFDTKLSQVHSVQIVSRFSPYQIPYNQVGRRPIRKTTSDIPRDHLNRIPQHVSETLKPESSATFNLRK